jgi:hypothetical protein
MSTQAEGNPEDWLPITPSRSEDDMSEAQRILLHRTRELLEELAPRKVVRARSWASLEPVMEEDATSGFILWLCIAPRRGPGLQIGMGDLAIIGGWQPPDSTWDDERESALRFKTDLKPGGDIAAIAEALGWIEAEIQSSDLV